VGNCTLVGFKGGGSAFGWVIVLEVGFLVVVSLLLQKRNDVMRPDPSDNVQRDQIVVLEVPAAIVGVVHELNEHIVTSRINGRRTNHRSGRQGRIGVVHSQECWSTGWTGRFHGRFNFRSSSG
jgi:hypothetical protein